MDRPEGGKKDNVSEPNYPSDDRPHMEIPTVRVQFAEPESPKSDADQPPTQDLNIPEKDDTDNRATFGCVKSDSNIVSRLQIDPTYSSDPSCLEPPDVRLFHRSTSLESGQSSSGKKIVRFADALGLDLAEVKRFKQSKVPKIPSSAFADLKLEQPKHLPIPSSSTKTEDVGETKLVFVPQFRQPGADAFFMDKLKDQKVCLENVVVSDFTVTGYIRTLNMGFEKLVQIRYTTNKWLSFEDMAADYLPSSSDGFSDKFTFRINLPNALLNEKLMFSIRYVVNGEEFWDNNYSQDFVIQCVAQKVCRPNF